MRQKSFKIIVAMVDPATDSEFEAVVDVADDIGRYAPKEPLITAVKSAAELFKQHLAATNGTDPDDIDETSFVIEHIAHQPGEEQVPVRYLVHGTYSDYPEGGAWGDWVFAVSSDDAELRGRFIMACNESSASFSSDGERPNVEDFETMVAATMLDIDILDASPDPVTKDEAMDLIKVLVEAGNGMVAAFGNCGSPAQQQAAKEMQEALANGQKALTAIAARHNPALAAALALEQRRRDAADAQADSYDYGYQVVGANGWEFTTPGQEWTRAVFFRDDSAPDEPSLKGTLTVVFADERSATVSDVFATLNGEATIGCPGSPLKQASQ
ncbi:MAG: hypothetical protein F8N36_13875 [Desulfovibrio sp.]|uniref:hypothetical protein n=1 Tax=Desulfovibrio sp. TaxID=885 RepID=UPI00135D4CFF|nr:hypothetical protein [Desulfovibrio sp.]MTJ93927.1 hypothetical protein [Desulfovibrio sp.]